MSRRLLIISCVVALAISYAQAYPAEAFPPSEPENNPDNIDSPKPSDVEEVAGTATNVADNVAQPEPASNPDNVNPPMPADVENIDGKLTNVAGEFAQPEPVSNLENANSENSAEGVQVDGKFRNAVDKFGSATREATDAVKGSIDTVIDAGRGVLATGNHLGHEVENVNNDVQHAIGKLGDAVKHSTDVVKEGVFTVLNMGKGKNIVEDVKGGVGNVINEIGHVAKDSNDAVKLGINSVVDAGNGVLRTGGKLGEEVQNVNKNVQGIFGKIGKAAKQTTDAIQEGIFATLGFGKNMFGGNRKRDVENNEGSIYGGVRETIRDWTRRTKAAVRGGISRLIEMGNDLFGKREPVYLPPDYTENSIEISDDDERFRRSSAQQEKNNKCQVWKEIAGDTLRTLENTADAVKEGVISVVDAGQQVAKAAVDIQNAQAAIESTLPRVGWNFVNSLLNPKKEDN